MNIENKCLICKLRILGVKFLLCEYFLDELSDHENMLDENDIEPDYYIDRPVT